MKTKERVFMTDELLKKFATVWAKSASSKEVSEAMGWGSSPAGATRVRVWAMFLRKNGVPLPHMQRGVKNGVTSGVFSELTALVQESSPESTSD